MWNVGSTGYIGTGIGNDKFTAVSCKSGGNTGRVMYAAKADGWDGVRTYAGGEEIGTERRTRR